MHTFHLLRITYLHHVFPTCVGVSHTIIQGQITCSLLITTCFYAAVIHDTVVAS